MITVKRSNFDTYYVCIATGDTKIRICTSCLDDILQSDNPSNGKSAITKLFKQKMKFYNDPSNDQIQRVQDKVDEVKDSMIENIGMMNVMD